MLNAQQIESHAKALLPAMKAMYRSLCSNPADVEDMLHDGYVYLTTYCLPAYKGGSNVKTFALQSLRRHYYDWSKAHCRSKTGSFPVDEDGNGGPDTMQGNSACALASLIQAERLDVALATLSANEKALCEAFVAHGNWAGAAEEVGVSAPTASRMLAKIQGKLAPKRVKPGRRRMKLTPTE